MEIPREENWAIDVDQALRLLDSGSVDSPFNKREEQAAFLRALIAEAWRDGAERAIERLSEEPVEADCIYEDCPYD